jgi:hypothetical protein
VRKDSETALRLVTKGGVVIWHDYGVWRASRRRWRNWTPGKS